MNRAFASARESPVVCGQNHSLHKLALLAFFMESKEKMNRFRVNKRVAAALSPLLLLLAANVFINLIYPTGRNVPRQDAGLDAPAPQTPVIALLLAKADPAKGEKLARKCEICHSLKEGGASRAGPELYNIVGRKIASIPGFAYSRALKAGDGKWTYEKLDVWLQNPHEASPSSKMTFAGMPAPQDRADLIAFLRTLSANPAPLPGVPASQPEPEAAPPGNSPAGSPAGSTGAAPSKE
jgi:cytochrome c